MPSLNMNVESNEQIVPSSSVNGSSSEAERVRRGAKGGQRRPGTCVNCDGRLLRKCKKSMFHFTRFIYVEKIAKKEKK